MNKLTEQNLLKKSRFLKYSLLASISVGAIIAIPFEGMAMSKEVFRIDLSNKLLNNLSQLNGNEDTTNTPQQIGTVIVRGPEINTYTPSEIREMEISSQSKPSNPLKDIPIEDHYKEIAHSKSEVGKARKVQPPTRNKTIVGGEKTEQSQNTYIPGPTEQTPQKPEIIITASSPTVSPASNSLVTAPNTPSTTLTSPEHYTTAPGTPSTLVTPYQPTPDSKPNDSVGANTPPNTNSKVVQKLSFSSEPQQTVQLSTPTVPPRPITSVPLPIKKSSTEVTTGMVSNISRVNETIGIKLAEVESTIKNTQGKKNKKPWQKLHKQLTASQKTTEALKSKAEEIEKKIKILSDQNKELDNLSKGARLKSTQKQDKIKIGKNEDKIKKLEKELTSKNNEVDRLSKEIDISVNKIVLTKPQGKAPVTEIPPAGVFLNQQQQLDVLTQQQKVNAARQAIVDKKRAEANEVKRNSAEYKDLKDKKQRQAAQKQLSEIKKQEKAIKTVVDKAVDIEKLEVLVSTQSTTSSTATIPKQPSKAKPIIPLSHGVQKMLDEQLDEYGGYLVPIKAQPQTYMLNQEVADPKSMDSGFVSRTSDTGFGSNQNSNRAYEDLPLIEPENQQQHDMLTIETLDLITPTQNTTVAKNDSSRKSNVSGSIPEIQQPQSEKMLLAINARLQEYDEKISSLLLEKYTSEEAEDILAQSLLQEMLVSDGKSESTLPAGDEEQEDIEVTDVSRESSLLPVSSNECALALSDGRELLQEMLVSDGKSESTLPAGDEEQEDTEVTDVSRESSLLPVSSNECALALSDGRELLQEMLVSDGKSESTLPAGDEEQEDTEVTDVSRESSLLPVSSNECALALSDGREKECLALGDGSGDEESYDSGFEAEEETIEQLSDSDGGNLKMTEVDTAIPLEQEAKKEMQMQISENAPTLNQAKVVNTIVNNMIRNRLDASMNMSNNMVAVGAGDEEEFRIKRGLWMRGMYGTNNHGRVDNMTGYRGTNKGATIGFDVEIDNNIVGIAYSNVHSVFKFKNSKNNDKELINSHVVSIYGQKELPKNFALQALVSASKNFIKDKTTYSYGDTKIRSNVKHRNHSYNAEALLNYNYLLQNKLVIIPNVGLRYGKSRDGVYNETGINIQEIALTMKENNILSGVIGTKVTVPLKDVLKFNNLGLIFQGAVEHNFKEKTQRINRVVKIFDTEFKQNYVIPKQPKTSYNLGTGIIGSIKSTTIALDYNYYLNKHYRSHQGSVKLKVNL
ncbi:autotransporter domain-containing protein [Rickettsia asiatica]|nr:autotransporter domain-containing protein [Rickettsia asiatica]